MIYDNSLLLSDAQAVTASAASTNVIDLGATGTPFGGAAMTRDIGIGCEPVVLSVRVTTTFATLTSLAVSVQTSPDNSTWTSISTGAAIAAASLVAGYQFDVPARFPEGTKARYVRLYYTVAGSNATAGAITAGVVADRQTNKTIGGA